MRGTAGALVTRAKTAPTTLVKLTRFCRPLLRRVVTCHYHIVLCRCYAVPVTTSPIHCCAVPFIVPHIVPHLNCTLCCPSLCRATVAPQSYCLYHASPVVIWVYGNHL